MRRVVDAPVAGARGREGPLGDEALRRGGHRQGEKQERGEADR
ncbi:hypothetical protein [Methylobacterium oryzisoli]